jgi:CDP-diacylglycerol---glycerol-3-phosphate 3-phosphatidyltransferase
MTMSIATYVTLLRLVIGPLFLIFYLEYPHNPILIPYCLIALLFISELSDAIDGYLARRYNQVTDLGMLLDPMADSIYRISVFLTFTLPPVKLPLLWVFIFLYRDIIISTLRTICALKGFTLAARRSGKIKAVIQGAAGFLITIFLLAYSNGILNEETLQSASKWVAALAALYTLFSGIEYLHSNWHYIMKLIRRV